MRACAGAAGGSFRFGGREQCGRLRSAQTGIVLQGNLAAQEVGHCELQEPPAHAGRAGACQSAQHLGQLGAVMYALRARLLPTLCAPIPFGWPQKERH